MRFMWVPKHKKTNSWGEEEHEHHHEHSKDWEDDVYASRKAECVGIKTVKQVLADPPSTWDAYEGKTGGYWHIVDMEEGELANARAAVKGGTKTEKAVIKELSHVAAACIHAINCITTK